MNVLLKKPLTRTAVQYAALPWRETGAGIEVLLISSRETRRWVIPKGWPMKGLKPHEAAVREAFEEAGVGGQIGRSALGHYEYMKRQPDRSELPCHVEVYGLEVMVYHRSWPEQGQRHLEWKPLHEAAASVAEAQLAEIIRQLR